MTARSSATLKGYFVLGAIPSESNFADLVDSAVLQTAAGAVEVSGTLKHAGTKLSFFNGALSDQYPLIVAPLTDITHTAPGTPDYAIQDLVQNTGFGFATKDEGNTLLKVILNLENRVEQLEAILLTYSLTRNA